MYKAVILPLAKEDIKRTAKWYNKQQKGLGKRFTKEVRKKVAHICKNPENIVTRYRDVKTAIVDVFPYMIHFIVDPKIRKSFHEYFSLFFLGWVLVNFGLKE